MILTQFLIFPPNWSDTVRLRYNWQTSIKRGIQGNERRTKLTTSTRRTISWQSLLSTNYERNLLLRRLFYYFQYVYGVPLWPYSTFLTADASISDVTIYCSTVNKNFFVGSLVLISAPDHISYDYGIIESLTDTSITLTSGLFTGFSEGAYVYPILQGRIKSNNSQEISQVTGKVAIVDFEIEEAFEDSQAFQPGAISYPTYNGYYVLNPEPNWAKNQQFGIVKPFEVLSSIGIDTSYCWQSEADFNAELNYSFYTDEACNDFENFFNNMCGRWNSFWLPTWNNDFVITAAIASTDDTLTIESIDYYSRWLNNDLIGRILFLKYGTVEVYRKIIAAPKSTQITLDSAVGIDVTLEELVTVVSCFLLPVRFNQDELEMEYYSNGQAECSIKFYSVNDSNMIPA